MPTSSHADTCQQLGEAHIYIGKLKRDIAALKETLADAEERLARWEDTASPSQVDVTLSGNSEQDEILRMAQKRLEHVSREFRTAKGQLDALKSRQTVCRRTPACSAQCTLCRVYL